GGRPRARTRPGTPAGGHGSPAITPDGKRMAFVAFSPEKTDLWISALDGSDARQLPSPMVHCYDPVFSADGRYLYFASVSTERHAHLYRVGFDAAKGTFAGPPTFIRAVELAIPRHLSVSRSGEKLTYSALTLTSNLWSLKVDPKTGEPTGTPEPVTREIA